MTAAEWIWQPDPARAATSRLGRLLAAFDLPCTPSGYAELHRRSVDDPAGFWPTALRDLGFASLVEGDTVVDLSRGKPWARWFPGARANAAEGCLDRWLPTRRDEIAIVWEGDRGEQRRLTLGELAEEVGRCAAALREGGVEQGDRVALFVPMLPETAASLLAILSLGAVAVPCFSGYGAEAVATRLGDCEAVALITTDGFYRRGKPVAAKQIADEAIERSGAPVRRVIVVPRLGSDAPGKVPWNQARDRWWPTTGNAADSSRGGGAGTGATASSAAREVERPHASTAAADPALIMYTSGTTGRPKGVVATHGGFPLKIATDMAYCFDVEQGDRMLWVTDLGWVMGPWEILGTLTLGASMVLFEGVPDFPAPDRLWEIAARHRVTHLGLAPTVVRNLREHGEDWVRRHDLAGVRVLGSTGEAWNAVPYQWYHRVVGDGRCPIINYSGGTEIGGGILGCTVLHPLKPCAFSVPILGIDADVWDGEGKPVRGAVGELVVKQPWPGMTDGFWKDPRRYEETYWSRWPDVWVHGDWARVDADGCWFIEGRSDDTIKVAGKRLGPAEAESLLVAHPGIVEAAAIEVPHPVKGGALVCFVVVQEGVPCGDQLRAALVERVVAGLGKALKPEAVLFARELPKTRNAKIMRRLIRAAHLEARGLAGAEAPRGDMSALENPQALEAVKQAT